MSAGWRVSLLVVLAGLAAPSIATAAFPGQNGKIAFQQTPGNVRTINPDGSGETSLRPGFSPAWSADGAQIAFDQGEDMWRMPADGSSQTLVHDNFVNQFGRGAAAHDPSWSPDSLRLAAAEFHCPDDTCQEYLRRLNVEGNPGDPWPQRIAATGADATPSWSPAGSRIAFFSQADSTNDFLDDGLYTVRPDGTDQQLAHPGPIDLGDPLSIDNTDWSPDGTKIVFSMKWHGATTYDIYVVPSGGGALTRLTNNAVEEKGPVWSPDGTQIAFSSNAGGDYEIYRMNADGSGVTQVTTNAAHDIKPSWQPIPVNAYPRPRAASPVRVSLVVAFPECTTPTKVHGPPLEHPSCGDNFNPPSGNSQHATVGTPDWNGAPAKFTGVVRIGARVGNPATPVDEADLRLQVSTTDIRCRPVAAPATCGASNIVGADYVGELQARVALRITDKDNTPTPSGPGAGTTVDMPYSFTVPCTGTADDNVGSACDVDTTADALLPATVKEGARAVWQLGQVEVLDGGPDGDADTNPVENDVFLRQGLLVP
jgi:hypothetical protein